MKPYTHKTIKINKNCLSINFPPEWDVDSDITAHSFPNIIKLQHYNLQHLFPAAELEINVPLHPQQTSYFNQ